MDQADELFEAIVEVIKGQGCEIVRKDIRIKEHGADWSMDLKVLVKPIAGEGV